MATKRKRKTAEQSDFDSEDSEVSEVCMDTSQESSQKSIEEAPAAGGRAGEGSTAAPARAVQSSAYEGDSRLCTRRIRRAQQFPGMVDPTVAVVELMATAVGGASGAAAGASEGAAQPAPNDGELSQTKPLFETGGVETEGNGGGHDEDMDECDKASAAAFKQADVNNNGYLSREETRLALSTLGLREDLDDNFLSLVISAIDVDDNGNVSLAEFQSWWSINSSISQAEAAESSDSEHEDSWNDDDLMWNDSSPTGEGGQSQYFRVPEGRDRVGIQEETVLTRQCDVCPTDQPVEHGQRGPVVHPKQVEVAENLLEKMQTRLGDSMACFSDFIPIVLIPDQNTLYDQTIRRMDEFFSHYQRAPTMENPGFSTGFCKAFGDGGRSSSDLVVKPGGTSSLQRLQYWCERITSEPHTLFLFVHDEAHWAAKANKINTNTWKEPQGANSWINNDIIRLSGNVVTLFVSATPYNLLTKRSQVPKDNIEFWFTPGDTVDKASVVYYGLRQFVSASCRHDHASATPPGCIVLDSKFEERVGQPTSKNRGTRYNVFRKDRLIAQYVAALEILVNGHQSQTDVQPSDVTFSMVKDLLKTKDGKGIMILIRVVNRADARDMRNHLIAAQKRLRLFSTFSVITDVDKTKKGSLRTCITPDFQKKMAVWQGKQCVEDVSIEAYSDLNDLPCVLILCEKGKMGDTFPESLRHYDLRLRYAVITSQHYRASVEQDLGRAFRYVQAGRVSRVPTVVVGPWVYEKLGLKEHDGRYQSIDFWKLPDANMTRHPGAGGWPKHEHDMESYRKCYEPKNPTSKQIAHATDIGNEALWEAGHFDSQYADREKWVNNPLRFLLVGLPQIGKTGSFLHLMYLLWRKVDNNKAYAPGPNPELPTFENEGEFPRYVLMQKDRFKDYEKCPGTCRYALRLKLNRHGTFGCPDHAPAYGKYGDPKVERLWKWSVTSANKERHPDADQYSSAASGGANIVKRRLEARCPPTVIGPVSEGTSAMSTGSANRLTGTEVTSASESGPATDNTEVQAKEILEKVDFDCQCWSGQVVAAAECKFFHVQTQFDGQTLDLGRLSIPVTTFSEWWQCVAGHTPTIKVRDEANAVKFPIFMPTNARSSTGLLDLTNSMRIPVSDPVAKPETLRYLQILVVKKGEQYELYRSKFPQLTIYELPNESARLGIGDARFCIQLLADLVCPIDMLGNNDRNKYCFVLDDSTRKFIGLTLADDPCPAFGKEKTGKMQWSEVSLGQSLMYLQSPRFVDRGKFAGIGFHRKGFGNIVGAYARAHIYSALLLNISWLKERHLYFRRDLWLWEDLDFNRRVTAQGGVLCKCYRYQQVTAQLHSGGCTSLVARGDGLVVTCVVHSEVCGVTKFHREITERLSRAIGPSGVDSWRLPVVVLQRLRENLLLRFEHSVETEIVDSMIESLDVTHVNSTKLPSATPLNLFEFVGDFAWEKVNAIHVAMLLNREPPASVGVQVLVTVGSTYASKHELPRNSLAKDSKGPLLPATLRGLKERYKGSLVVLAVNDREVSAAARDVATYKFSVPWRDVQSITLGHKMPLTKFSFRAGEVLHRGRDKQFVIRVLEDQPEGGARLEGSFEVLHDYTATVKSKALGKETHFQLKQGQRYTAAAVAEELKKRGFKTFQFLNRNQFEAAS